MPELRDLYQEVILEHSKAPRNYKEPPAANQRAEGYNPLCGDRFTVYLEMDGDRIREIGFQGAGCAISKASASMMTQSVKGKTKAEAHGSSSSFINWSPGIRTRIRLSWASWRCFPGFRNSRYG